MPMIINLGIVWLKSWRFLLLKNQLQYPYRHVRHVCSSLVGCSLKERAYSKEGYTPDVDGSTNTFLKLSPPYKLYNHPYTYWCILQCTCKRYIMLYICTSWPEITPPTTMGPYIIALKLLQEPVFTLWNKSNYIGLKLLKTFGQVLPLQHALARAARLSISCYCKLIDSYITMHTSPRHRR